MAQVDKQIDMKHDDTAQQLTFSPEEMSLIYDALNEAHCSQIAINQSTLRTMSERDIYADELIEMGRRLKLFEHLIARMDDANWDEVDEEHEALTDEQQIEIFGHVTQYGIPD